MFCHSPFPKKTEGRDADDILASQRQLLPSARRWKLSSANNNHASKYRSSRIWIHFSGAEETTKQQAYARQAT